MVKKFGKKVSPKKLNYYKYQWIYNKFVTEKS